MDHSDEGIKRCAFFFFVPASPFIIFVNRVRFVVVRGAILSRFDARFEEESCGFFRLREFIQRERGVGEGSLWLEWHVVVEGW